MSSQIKQVEMLHKLIEHVHKSLTSANEKIFFPYQLFFNRNINEKTIIILLYVNFICWAYIGFA